ncbi:uncharacterized protein V6R79_010964 [Siganus canaliculatus]
MGQWERWDAIDFECHRQRQRCQCDGKPSPSNYPPAVWICQKNNQLYVNPLEHYLPPPDYFRLL